MKTVMKHGKVYALKAIIPVTRTVTLPKPLYLGFNNNSLTFYDTLPGAQLL